MRPSLIRLNVVALTLCAMLLRGLLPAGWMPDANSASNGFVICTLDSSRYVQAPQRPDQHDPASKHDNAVCPFAASAYFAAIQHLPQLIASSTAFYAVPSFTRHATFPDRFGNRAHPVRAPPVLA